jgi:hypothetical protein
MEGRQGTLNPRGQILKGFAKGSSYEREWKLFIWATILVQTLRSEDYEPIGCISVPA